MEFEYEIVRTDRKTVGISVLDGGRVVVRAPRRIKEGELSKIVERYRSRIEKMIEKSQKVKRPELSKEEKELLRRICRVHFADLLERYSALMGVRPTALRISSAKKRFGSCSSRGSISVSLYAMLYPEAARELVAVHELCHLRHMDHSRDFYSLLARYLPDHKERKKLLKVENMLTVGEVLSQYGGYLLKK